MSKALQQPKAGRCAVAPDASSIVPICISSDFCSKPTIITSSSSKNFPSASSMGNGSDLFKKLTSLKNTGNTALRSKALFEPKSVSEDFVESLENALASRVWTVSNVGKPFSSAPVVTVSNNLRKRKREEEEDCSNSSIACASGKENEISTGKSKRVKRKYRGLTWVKSRKILENGKQGKWRVVLYHCGKRKNIGYFLCKKDAALAYDKALLELYPNVKLSKLNFPEKVKETLSTLHSPENAESKKFYENVLKGSSPEEDRTESKTQSGKSGNVSSTQSNSVLTSTPVESQNQNQDQNSEKQQSKAVQPIPLPIMSTSLQSTYDPRFRLARVQRALGQFPAIQCDNFGAFSIKGEVVPERKNTLQLRQKRHNIKRLYDDEKLPKEVVERWAKEDKIFLRSDLKRDLLVCRNKIRRRVGTFLCPLAAQTAAEVLENHLSNIESSKSEDTVSLPVAAIRVDETKASTPQQSTHSVPMAICVEETKTSTAQQSTHSVPVAIRVEETKTSTAQQSTHSVPVAICVDETKVQSQSNPQKVVTTADEESVQAKSMMTHLRSLTEEIAQLARSAGLKICSHEHTGGEYHCCPLYHKYRAFCTVDGCHAFARNSDATLCAMHRREDDERKCDERKKAETKNNTNTDTESSGHQKKKKKYTYQCDFINCTKHAIGKRDKFKKKYCQFHGGGRRCIVDGCNRISQRCFNTCIEHGGQPRRFKLCSFLNCNKIARNGGFCPGHSGKKGNEKKLFCIYPGCRCLARRKNPQACRLHTVILLKRNDFVAVKRKKTD